jgi:ribosomal protein L32
MQNAFYYFIWWYTLTIPWLVTLTGYHVLYNMYWLLFSRWFFVFYFHLIYSWKWKKGCRWIVYFHQILMILICMHVHLLVQLDPTCRILPSKHSSVRRYSKEIQLKSLSVCHILTTLSLGNRKITYKICSHTGVYRCCVSKQ